MLIMALFLLECFSPTLEMGSEKIRSIQMQFQILQHSRPGFEKVCDALTRIWLNDNRCCPFRMVLYHFWILGCLLRPGGMETYEHSSRWYGDVGTFFQVVWRRGNIFTCGMETWEHLWCCSSARISWIFNWQNENPYHLLLSLGHHDLQNKYERLLVFNFYSMNLFR